MIIPDFGGIVANYQPAKMHPVTYMFNPPAKSLAFNVNLRHNDGLLLYKIVAAEQITAQEAEKKLKAFVADIRQTLSENKTYKLFTIGRLLNDIEGNIQFIPDANENYLQEAYGLFTINTAPVLRKKDDTIKHLQPNTETILKPVKSKRRYWLAAASVFLFLLAGFQYSFLTQNEKNNLAETFSVQNFLHKERVIARHYDIANVTINTAFTHSYRSTDTLHIDTTTTEPGISHTDLHVETQPTPAFSATAKYLMIAGVYAKKEMTEEISAMLRAKNYASEIVIKNNMYMIASPIPENVNMVQYRQTFADATGIHDAWVMKNQH